MSAAPLGVRRLAPAVPLAVAIAAAASVTVAWSIVRAPELVRTVGALVIGVDLLICALRWPRAAAIVTLALLPVLSLLRRILIPVAGWSSHDPLLLVAPIVAGFLCIRLFVIDRRRLGGDRLSLLVVVVGAFAVVQSLNPMNHGLAAGLGGFLFLGVPLLWFFIGRELADTASVRTLLLAFVALAIPIALYGLSQANGGLPSWDRQWAQLDGYRALDVGGEIRPFGSFASAAEYARFLGTAAVVAAVLLVRRPAVTVVALPLAATALFFASARTALVLTAAALLIILALRFARGALAVAVIVLAAAGAVAGLAAAAPGLTQRAASSGNALVTHQVGGLVQPLDPKQSTLRAHLSEFTSGLGTSLHHPLGQGTASVTIAGQTLGGAVRNDTEVDVSNVFVALGVLPGLAFAALVVLSLRGVLRLYRRLGDPLLLGVLGVLIVGFGQWLNGGHYAMSPLTWFLIGWTVRLGATTGHPDLGRDFPATVGERLYGPPRHGLMDGA